MGTPKQKNVIWTRGINHSDYFWLVNMGLHFNLPTSLLAYIMTCSGCVIFNLTIYCHVKRCLGTMWSPLTVFMRMSMVLPIQNCWICDISVWQYYVSDLQKCSCWWCKSCCVGGWKSVQSLSIMIENFFLKLFSKILLNWGVVDRFLHHSYGQDPLLGPPAFCWCKCLRFFVLCETLLGVLSPF